MSRSHITNASRPLNRAQTSPRRAHEKQASGERTVTMCLCFACWVPHLPRSLGDWMWHPKLPLREEMRWELHSVSHVP